MSGAFIAVGNAQVTQIVQGWRADAGPERIILITNTGANQVYIDNQSNVNPTNFDYVLPPGASVKWTQTSPCWAICDPGNISQVNVADNSTDIFDPTAIANQLVSPLSQAIATAIAQQGVPSIIAPTLIKVQALPNGSNQFTMTGGPVTGSTTIVAFQNVSGNVSGESYNSVSISWNTLPLSNPNTETLAIKQYGFRTGIGSTPKSYVIINEPTAAPYIMVQITNANGDAWTTGDVVLYTSSSPTIPTPGIRWVNGPEASDWNTYWGVAPSSYTASSMNILQSAGSLVTSSAKVFRLPPYTGNAFISGTILTTGASNTLPFIEIYDPLSAQTFGSRPWIKTIFTYPTTGWNTGTFAVNVPMTGYPLNIYRAGLAGINYYDYFMVTFA